MAKRVTGHRVREEFDIGGGHATTHLSATDGAREHRETQQAKAAWYLYRTGNRELWQVLGLDPRPRVSTRADHV